MIEAIITDLQSRLEYHDWVALFAVLGMLATPFIIATYYDAKANLKNYINKKLAPHGLRLKERV